MTFLKLHVLGSGTPQPNKERWGSGFVVESQGEFIMFDCGPASTYKMIQMDLDPRMVNSLFFTHHHSDHDLDYPTFLIVNLIYFFSQIVQLPFFLSLIVNFSNFLSLYQ